jgi:DUF4097 and DUF4098 domain-containing protein YvlB
MQYYRTIDHSFEVDPSPELRVENRRGEIVVVAEDRDDITFTAQMVVNADSEQEGEQRLDAIQLPISATRAHVQIGPPAYDEHSALSIFGISIQVPRTSTRIDMQLRVPKATRVKTRARAGLTRVTGADGDLDVGSRSGRIELRELGGDVQVGHRSGGIEIRETNGRVRIDGRSGKIEIEGVEGDVEVKNRSGSTSIQRVRGDVTIASRSGRIRLEDIEGRIRVRTGSASVGYRGAVAGPIDIELGSGSVRLAVTRDSAFWMDAETRAGSIRSELPVDYLKEPTDDAHTVRVRAGSGSIRVITA